MPDLKDGESVEMQGSARLPYVLKNVGGVYSCTCPAWRNQSLPIERRTCKHLKMLRGDVAEQQRIGTPSVERTVDAPKTEKQVPALLLAESWDNNQDPTGWWLSEKLDGVRAWWDGNSSAHGKETFTMLPIGSRPVCRISRWMVNCGWPAKRSSGP